MPEKHKNVQKFTKPCFLSDPRIRDYCHQNKKALKNFLSNITTNQLETLRHKSLVYYQKNCAP